MVRDSVNRILEGYRLNVANMSSVDHRRVTVLLHQELDKGNLNAIIKQAGLKAEDSSGWWPRGGTGENPAKSQQTNNGEIPPTRRTRNLSYRKSCKNAAHDGQQGPGSQELRDRHAKQQRSSRILPETDQVSPGYSPLIRDKQFSSEAQAIFMSPS